MLRIYVYLRQANCCFEQAVFKQWKIPYLVSIVLDRGVKKSTHRQSEGFVGFRCTQPNLHFDVVIAKCETQQQPISEPSPKSFYFD